MDDVEMSIEPAIMALADKIIAGVSAGDALDYSQAALNLANTLSTMRHRMPSNPNKTSAIERGPL